PFVRGGYALGNPVDEKFIAKMKAAIKTLLKPVGEKVYFAGEHVPPDEKSLGYIHGAAASGKTAAMKILCEAGLHNVLPGEQCIDKLISNRLFRKMPRPGRQWPVERSRGGASGYWLACILVDECQHAGDAASTPKSLLLWSRKESQERAEEQKSSKQQAASSKPHTPHSATCSSRV
ncbi:hypothetical protein THAOC_08581, partial [Thalassiosira oceanica]